MSTSIDEALDEAGRRTEDLRKIRDRFPDAVLTTLPNGSRVWSSEHATSHFDGVDFVADSRGFVYIAGFVKVGDHGRVYGSDIRDRLYRTVIDMRAYEGLTESLIAFVRGRVG